VLQLRRELEEAMPAVASAHQLQDWQFVVVGFAMISHNLWQSERRCLIPVVRFAAQDVLEDMKVFQR